MPRAEFDGLDIAYDERVLTPRSWTVAQSRWAAELAAVVPDGPILELCAGAGHIGLAVAVRTGRPLHQVERDPVACAFASRNAAAAAGREASVTVHCCSLDELVLPASSFPLVLADPPYLTPAEVARYPQDPREAIDGGPDGLEHVRACLEVIDRVLDPDGRALLQLRGAPQVAAVRGVLEGRGGLCAGEARTYGAERAVLLLARR